MSASTAEAIDEGRQMVDDRDAPDDPVEYMVWLRRRREGLVRRNYKRIIDLGKGKHGAAGERSGVHRRYLRHQRLLPAMAARTSSST